MSMSAEHFPEGAIVYLKSGSPPLTVTGPPRSDGVIEVQWFAGANICRDAFPAVCLSATQDAEWSKEHAA